jgi:hypothetical protein
MEKENKYKERMEEMRELICDDLPKKIYNNFKFKNKEKDD